MAQKETFHMHPFSWGFKNEDKFESLMEQREASYTKPFETTFNVNNYDEAELMWDTFMNNTMAPTTPLAMVDGYKSAEEVSGKDAETKEPVEDDTQIHIMEEEEEAGEMPNEEPEVVEFHEETFMD